MPKEKKIDSIKPNGDIVFDAKGMIKDTENFGYNQALKDIRENLAKKK